MSTKKVVTTKSKSSKTNGKYINPKNYLYALLILIGGILLVLYVFEWYQVKKEEKLVNSYLITSKTINYKIEDLSSLTQIRQEAPSSYFIFLSYTKDEEVYNLEKNLKRVIDKYKLNDVFYYVDVTNIMEQETYLDNIKSALGVSILDKIPAIIYVHEGKILESNVLDGVGKDILKVEDLEDILEIYEFEAVK